MLPDEDTIEGLEIAVELIPRNYKINQTYKQIGKGLSGYKKLLLYCNIGIPSDL